MVNFYVNSHCRGDLKSNHVDSDHIILHLSTITMLYNHNDAAGFILMVEIIWLKFSFLLFSSMHWRIKISHVENIGVAVHGTYGHLCL